MHFLTIQFMNSMELSQADKKRIKDDIKLTFIFGILIVLALILLVTIGPLIYKLFGGEPKAGLGKRLLIIVGGLSIPLVAVSWMNILKYCDLLSGKKIVITSSYFRVERTKDDAFLITKAPRKLKLRIYESIVPLIDPSEPLTIQITKLSKTLLFASHDTTNLIEKVEMEETK
jgi:hypothetical protein